MGAWLYPEGFANILLLKKLEKKYCLTYNSAANYCFEVYKSDITKFGFMPSKKGLFYSSVNNDVATALF